ncbi:hypothetical protein J6590_090770 [Homalodisca vitripennis]|nr:hypothetical protein J6590_090770 [Homalodisca vitripennis]
MLHVVKVKVNGRVLFPDQVRDNKLSLTQPGDQLLISDFRNKVSCLQGPDRSAVTHPSSSYARIGSVILQFYPVITWSGILSLLFLM